MTQPPTTRPCRRCSTCCVAPDIAALGKPLGVRCAQLLESGLCAIYAQRPDICRRYQPDELCDTIHATTLDERVRNYLTVFGLTSSQEGA